MKKIVLELTEEERQVFYQMIDQAAMQYNVCPESLIGDDESFEGAVTTLFKKLREV